MSKTWKWSKKRWITALAAAGLAMLFISGCNGGDEASNSADPAAPAEDSQAANPDDPLALFPPLKLPFTVEPDEVIVAYQGGELTAQEFERFMKAVNFFNPAQGRVVETADQETIKLFVREVAATKILASRADEATRTESKTQAEQTFDLLKQQYLGMLGDDEAKFEQLLEMQKVTCEEIVGEMAMINDSIAVLSQGITDAELDKLYEADKDAYTIASVRHILIGTDNRKPEEALKLAQEIAARLKQGEDFAKLAAEYSDDPGSKDSGGLYEDVEVDLWVPEFKEAALTLPIGQISDPVKTDYGYHVMKVEKRGKNTEKLRQAALESRYDDFSNNDLDKLITKWNLPEVKPASS